jgi:hypothetical protein
MREGFLTESRSEMPDDPELGAMNTVLTALESLPEAEAKVRVLTYVMSRLKLASIAKTSLESRGLGLNKDTDSQEELAPDELTNDNRKFSSFAELFDRANPQSRSDMALVAGYWIQVINGNDDVAGAAINTELKHLGHRLSNITGAIDSLRNCKPALVVQLRKSGSTKQARKKYKVTDSGIKAVLSMLRPKE